MTPRIPQANRVLRRRRGQRTFMTAWLMPVMLLACGSSLATPIELGRLFYTPVQRAQLEAARSRNGGQTAGQGAQTTPRGIPAPVRFDGMVIRSDGKTTRWVDGKPQLGTSAIPGMKPGQIRMNSKIYEPYQVLRPVNPDASPGVNVEEPAP